MKAETNMCGKEWLLFESPLFRWVYDDKEKKLVNLLYGAELICSVYSVYNMSNVRLVYQRLGTVHYLWG